VDDDVGAECERPQKVRGGEGAVDDEGQAVGMGYRGDGSQIEDVDLGVADRLGVQRLGPRGDGPGEVGRVAWVDEMDFDASRGKV